MKTNWVECIVLLLLILLCGGSAYVFSERALDLNFNGIKTVGDVISSSSSRHSSVGYRDASGKKYKIPGPPSLRVGDVVEVIYLSRHPNEGSVNAWSELYLIPLVFGSFLLAFLMLLIKTIRS